MKITKEMLNKMSFIDYEVNNILIYQKTNSIIFNFSGASYLKNNVREELKKGYIKIEHFDSLKITSYSATSNETKEAKAGNQEKLKQLCEIELLKDKLIFKGYAEDTYNWLEFEINGGVLEGDFIENN